MKNFIRDKTFIFLIISILLVALLLSLSLFREAVLVWLTVNVLILIYKRSFIWVIYLLIVNILVFPTGGDFKESRLLYISGFPITIEKSLVLIALVLMFVRRFNSLKEFIKGFPRSAFDTVKNDLALSLMVFFLFISALSIVFSPFEPSKLRFALFALGFALFFIISKGVESKEEIKSILLIFATGVILVSLYALVEFPLAKNIFYGTTGFKEFVTGDIYRVKATQGIPLVLSSLINMIFPLVLVLLLHFRKSYIKYVFIAGLVVLTLAQIVTFTRTGWLVFALEFVFLLIIFRKSIIDLISGSIKNFPKGPLIVSAIFFSAIAYVVIVNLVVFVDFRTATDETYTAPSLSVKQPQQERRYGEANVTSIKARLQSLELSRRVLLERPILGVGLGGFSSAVGVYGQDLDILKKSLAADNSYNMLVTETGLVGIVTFLSILITVIGKTFKVFYISRDKFFKNIFLAVLITQCGVVLQSAGFEVFSFAHTTFVFWILSGLVFAYHRIELAKAT